MEETAGGTIAGHPVAFPAAHRDGDPNPATIPVTVALPLSHGDVQAVLWLLIESGWTVADLATVDHTTILDTIQWDGMERVWRARRAIEHLVPGTEAWQLFDAVAARVIELYGPEPSAGYIVAARPGRPGRAPAPTAPPPTAPAPAPAPTVPAPALVGVR